MHNRSGERNDLRCGLNELRICQGIHMDIRRVNGMLELGCLGQPDLQGGGRERSVALCTVGTWERENRQLRNKTSLTVELSTHRLQSKMVRGWLRIGKESKNRSQEDMLVVQGAALRAGTWSQVRLASMKNVGSYRIPRRRERGWIGKGKPTTTTTTTTARRGRFG